MQNNLILMQGFYTYHSEMQVNLHIGSDLSHLVISYFIYLFKNKIAQLGLAFFKYKKQFELEKTVNIF